MHVQYVCSAGALRVQWVRKPGEAEMKVQFDIW